jgi:hypothetical protein
MTIPAAIMPLLLIAGGGVLIVLGFAWLQDEGLRSERGVDPLAVLDPQPGDNPMFIGAAGLMVLGAVLIYVGWTRLP